MYRKTNRQRRGTTKGRENSGSSSSALRRWESSINEPYEQASEISSEFVSSSAHQAMPQEVMATVSPGSRALEGEAISVVQSNDQLSQSNEISGDTEAHAAASLESSVDLEILRGPLLTHTD
jgi:hypothetical protein